MHEILSGTRPILGEAPEDLVSFYQAGELPVFPGSRVYCLEFDAALEYNRAFSGIEVAARLGLWVLDDANDSNPFAYISKGLCKGMIVHFAHDDEQCIKFASLNAFVKALNQLGQCGGDLSELEGEEIAMPLGPVLEELLEEGSADADFLIILYLKAAVGLSPELKSRLAHHEDFLIRESFADFLVRNPSQDDLALAEHLAAESYGQVARPAKVALAAIKRARYLG
ncbi:hypothetical protein [Haloferula sp. BvORR071]|uniref:hypothetical protein n=1 Tax=Haloferula sp. BvORR071 TaxID=1396141 RepID=UPI00054E9453|nr:hypothetical protein [Haloferula sp. BvORR071]